VICHVDANDLLARVIAAREENEVGSSDEVAQMLADLEADLRADADARATL
jgi:hypothetical protein